MLDRIKYFILNNKKAVLIVSAVLLVIIIVIFSIPKKKLPEPVAEVKVPGQEIAAAPTIQKTALTEDDRVKQSISVAAKNFADFYGSYSNQSNYSNLESVLPLLSASYRTQMSQALSQYRASYQPGATYEGVTTSAIGSPVFQMLDIASGKATVVVKTQRQFSTGTQANYTLKTQDIKLVLVKENDSWLVDSATWL